MLVVIAIIALLAALLIGGLAKSKQKVYQVKTLSNLRQLHQANLQHAMDYKDFYVPHRLNKAEDSDNPDTYWLDNDHFSVYLYRDDHNGLDDWPSIYKTGTPKGNSRYKSPPGALAKMTIGICLGGFRNHWEEGAFRRAEIDQHPMMIMFADSSSWLIHGGAVDSSLKEFDESKGGPFGSMAFRYDGKAGIVTVAGNASMVRYENILPRSEFPQIWPNVRPEKFDLYDR